jgi:hypothetical protein
MKFIVGTMTNQYSWLKSRVQFIKGAGFSFGCHFFILGRVVRLPSGVRAVNIYG